ncbi:unnamed protein product [Medioppia subpectinata]|uniref:Uncharacterized protein n=1 Tax=Medioppia subpectinata TaxID=1979941 RepID=A0A7R9PTW9_9ACAR|nr:unnamed protein product [Medioppia subpectinata]CAG2100162.1 unnamed protein product [Medioppia subpectinata]
MAIYTSTESLSKGCGIGSWRPKWLQRWATANMFILMLAIIGTLQSSAFAYTVASVTTLEKRYAFNSFISGIILIADDISGLIFKPIYGYLANHVHRPRLIGCSTILVGIGCYLAALPYFIYGPAVHLLSKTVSANQSMGAEFCDANRTLVDECVDDDNYFSFPILPVLLPFMSMFLNGLGSAAVYYVGIPFLDDSVDKKKSPMYISM